MLPELCEEVLKGEIEVAKRPLITKMSESISEYRNKLSKSRAMVSVFTVFI